jgi:hypothetical protein
MENNIIESCKKYMLLEEKIILNTNKFNTTKSNMTENNSDVSKNNSDVSKNNSDVSKNNKEILHSKKQRNFRENKESILVDELFWCFFTILKGENKYELDHSFKREKEFKIESIEKMRDIKTELKAIKLRLNEIENELLNEKKITIKTLIALCLLYKINILYVWKRKYFEMINDSDKEINIIVNENGKDRILDTNDTKIKFYRENYWCIENIIKPIKAITAYSRDELITIVNKLEIKDISTKKTKKEMYEKIIQNIS